MDEYADRNEILYELGYRDYKHYLRSKLWKEIRERVLERDKYKCFGCGRDDDKITIQVHHGKYTHENLTGQNINHMFTVCARCHHWIEVTRAGYKRNPTAATRELFRVRKLYVLRQNNKPDIPRNRIAPRNFIR